MRGKMKLALLALAITSCSKEGHSPERGLDYTYGMGLTHDCIVLGDRLENPYKTDNVTKALQSLYPTKADRVDLKTTDLYVRFLPQNEAEFRQLEAMGLYLTDHPLDYAIKVDGDWYHDPEVPRDAVTWQYAVVSRDFKFPDMEYEIIDECYLSENDPGTRSDGIDWGQWRERLMCSLEMNPFFVIHRPGLRGKSSPLAESPLWTKRLMAEGPLAWQEYV